MSEFQQAKDLILGELGTALEGVDPEAVDRLIEAIDQAEQVFVVGVGRVMLALQAMAKRLHHLGIKTHVVGEITEPAITERDLLIVGSGSGESAVPVAIARLAKKHGAQVAHIGSSPESSMSELTDLFVRIPSPTKRNLPGEVKSAQPMTTLFDQSLLILGDIICLMIIERKGLDLNKLWQYHANLE